MKDLPYFKWWVADAEAEELYASLSLEELGLYHRCLNRSWISDGIPADTKALAAVIHISPSRLAKLWPSIAAKWSESTRDPTRLINTRQERERDAVIHVSNANKRDGNANATRTRRERYANETPNEREKTPHALARESESESESESKSKKCGGTPPEEPPPPQIAEYPKTTAAIQTRFPSADLVLVGRIVDAAARAFVSQDHPKIPEPGDAEFAAAVEAATKEANGKQTSAALFLRTVPAVIASWAKHGRGGAEPRRLYPVFDPRSITG